VGLDDESSTRQREITRLEHRFATLWRGTLSLGKDSLGLPNRSKVDQSYARWNQLLPWLRRVDTLRGGQVLNG
jgi:hypothetical protein